jgi:hypothetical protein
VDLETQNVKGKSGPSTYKSWGYQLAAYRRALGRPVVCINLIMNSREPSPPVEAVWSEEQLEVSWVGFEAALTLWRVKEILDPRVGNPQLTSMDAKGDSTAKGAEIAERAG